MYTVCPDNGPACLSVDKDIWWASNDNACVIKHFSGKTFYYVCLHLAIIVQYLFKIVPNSSLLSIIPATGWLSWSVTQLNVNNM